MTTASGYTQTHRSRPGDRTTEAEPLVLLSPEQATRIVIVNRHYVNVSHCLYWTRGRYTERHTASNP